MGEENVTLNLWRTTDHHCGEGKAITMDRAFGWNVRGKDSKNNRLEKTGR